MQIEKRLKNHYKRWNIEFSYEEEFLKFKNRLVRIIDKLIGVELLLNSDVDKDFIEIFNFHQAHEPYVNTYYNEEDFFDLDTKILRYIKDCKNTQELATVLQFMFWALEKNDETQNLVLQIVKEIRRLSPLTPSAAFQIYKKGKQVIIYPYGDEFLDIGIIDCVLSGLEDYPKVAEPFEKALKIYQSGEISLYRNLLDNLRFALEQLCRQILNNEKQSLENLKPSLLRWLHNKGLHKEVSNLYEKLLSQYEKYQNNAVKHNENYSIDEVEFMIYLTGNFIRLILQLARQVNNVTES